MNQTTLTAVGTLITPVQLRRTPDGTPVTSFRIACNERRFDRGSGVWVDRETLYASVTCWRRLAENVCASFRSGDPIIVRGRIFTRSYDKDGRRNSVTEIEADVVGPDVTRCTTTIVRTGRTVTDQAGAVLPSTASAPWSSAVPDDVSGAYDVDEVVREEMEPPAAALAGH